jgi:hypothetical protein
MFNYPDSALLQTNGLRLKTVIFSRTIITVLLLLYAVSKANGQQETITKDQYILGEEQKMEIVVHIWGEVKQPGEYIVPDGTDVLELISKAGGYTEYSNITNIRLTRGKLGSTSSASSNTGLNKTSMSIRPQRVITIDLKKYLKNDQYESLPLLLPGDTVTIGRNKWYKLQTMIRVISQVAIIAQAWYYYSQID